MSPVDAYFDRTKSNPARLAAQMGCAPSTITRMLKGERRANTDMAQRVEAATEGGITAVDFLAHCMSAKAARAAEPDVAA